MKQEMENLKEVLDAHAKSIIDRLGTAFDSQKNGKTSSRSVTDMNRGDSQ
ncbi:MAG: hypothetical protein LBM08_05955 [Dysgonamonadaceae bacterium]|jgi:hypothetical protein|nr:hypothetical protein [Dysgonamonadaceae bacterium]